MGDDRQDAAAAGLARRLPGLASLRAYDRAWLGTDVVAGLSVAAVALPVGIAYADLVGVPAQYGIYAAIFPMLAYVLMGSSRSLIVGPDAATCLLLAASVAPLAGGDPSRYLALVSAATLLTGVVLIVAGVARLGFLASFLSQPILTGYMNGIAVVLILGQLPKILGYRSVAHEPLARLAEAVRHLVHAAPATAAIGLGSVAGLIAMKRLAPKLPAALIAIAVSVVAVALFDLGARGVALTGEVPVGLPVPRWPVLEPEAWRTLLGDAAGIALISFTAGLLTAKSFARRSRDSIDANQELVAFGASNILAGLTQGFAVSGTDSRTAVAIAMGGRSQIVSLVAAAAMLVAMLFLAGAIALTPGAALGAVVLVSAFGLFDFKGLRDLVRMSRVEAGICIATTLGVLVFGVLQGVVVAVVLSLGWLLSLSLRPNDAILGRVPGRAGFHNIAQHAGAQTMPGLLIYRFEANLVFYNVESFADRLRATITAAREPVRWVVVDLSPVSLIDATALQRFEELRDEFAARGISLCVAAARRNLARAFREDWARQRRSAGSKWRFDTLDAAAAAFEAARRTGKESTLQD